MNLYTNINRNITKTYFLLFIFVLLFGVFGYFISYYFKNQAFTYLALIYAIISSFIGY